MKYSQRVVAFLDILGFKNMVLDTNDESKIFTLMKYLKMIENNNYEGCLKVVDLGMEITVFSDSIVISYDVNSPGQVFFILLEINRIQLELASRGIILRGGVSIGKLYHNREIVFGPAMIKSYELESKYAKYPRVIIDEQLLAYAYSHNSSQNTRDQELNYVLNLLLKDEDGYFYTNFLAQYCELDYPNDIIKIIETLKKLIEKYIDSDNESVKEKYQWLNSYVNKFNYQVDIFN